MKVIEKYNDSLHNPFWKYQLGPETYEVKDTPLRVATIKETQGESEDFEFVTTQHYPEHLISRLHP